MTPLKPGTVREASVVCDACQAGNHAGCLSGQTVQGWFILCRCRATRLSRQEWSQ